MFSKYLNILFSMFGKTNTFAGNDFQLPAVVKLDTETTKFKAGEIRIAFAEPKPKVNGVTLHGIKIDANKTVMDLEYFPSFIDPKIKHSDLEKLLRKL